MADGGSGGRHRGRVPLSRAVVGGLAGLSIVDQPTDDYDCVCISSWGYHPNGDRCYDVAAELYRQKPSCRVLIVTPGPSRLEEVGVLPSFAATSRRELAARHVPQEAVSILGGEPWNDWATAQRWPTGRASTPATACLCSVPQFHSRQMRRAMDDVLEPATAASLRVQALRNRDYDDTNWWTSRCGYRAFGESWLLRLQRRPGGSAAKMMEKNADQYERDFLQALPERTPWSRRWLVALLLAVVVLAACWAAYPRLLRAAASWLDVGQRPHKADYVMLLNGGENSRPFAAAALVKGHWARRVLVAETAASPEVIDGIVPPYHEINRRVLLSSRCCGGRRRHSAQCGGIDLRRSRGPGRIPPRQA